MSDFYTVGPEGFAKLSDAVAGMMESGVITFHQWSLYAVLVSLANRGQSMTFADMRYYVGVSVDLLGDLAALEKAGVMDDTLRAVITDYERS